MGMCQTEVCSAFSQVRRVGTSVPTNHKLVATAGSMGSQQRGSAYSRGGGLGYIAFTKGVKE